MRKALPFIAGSAPCWRCCWRRPWFRPKSKKKIVFIAGNPSHGFGAHEHKAGCMLLAKCLNESGLPVTTEVVTSGWPKDEAVLDGADGIVIYADGGGGHPANAASADDRQARRARASASCASTTASRFPRAKSGDRFLDWIGGYFEAHWSVNPHWTAKFDEVSRSPDHPRRQAVRDQRRVVLSHAVSRRR